MEPPKHDSLTPTSDAKEGFLRSPGLRKEADDLTGETLKIFITNLHQCREKGATAWY
jgi:hypothetical protein